MSSRSQPAAHPARLWAIAVQRHGGQADREHDQAERDRDSLRRATPLGHAHVADPTRAAFRDRYG